MRWWIANEARGAELAIHHLISNKCEWNNCFTKNAHKISTLFVKTTDFQLVFNIEQRRQRARYN